MVFQLDKAEIENFIKKINFQKFNGLVPVIVQDASTRKVLMQAFMDKDAVRLTLSSGKTHFWSRSRKRLWRKGEESGHSSLVQNAILDCDNDALLFKVQQIGTVCHTGEETCFHKPILCEAKDVIDAKILERIFEVIVDRINNPTENSYVYKLTSKSEDEILQKIGEETVELILAAKVHRTNELIHETTDIIFHLLVLLAQEGLDLRDVFVELERRHRKKT